MQIHFSAVRGDALGTLAMPTRGAESASTSSSDSRDGRERGRRRRRHDSSDDDSSSSSDSSRGGSRRRRRDASRDESDRSRDRRLAKKARKQEKKAKKARKREKKEAKREAKRARRTLLSVGTMVEWEENAHVCAGQKVPERERKPFNAVGLDPNHSHFILVENEEYKVGPSGFGSEQGVRAAFEKCLADNSYFRRSPTAKEHPFSVFKPAPDLLDSEAADDVPLVCVCVQGGPGTVGTVLNAVMQDIPALLVRGSGKASDLLSDAVLLKRIAHLFLRSDSQRHQRRRRRRRPLALRHINLIFYYKGKHT